MSETDSFIDEVTEEVRRDRLFALFRTYGWIGILAILILVGGASWREWQKARAEAASQSFGDALVAALGQNEAAGRADALASVDAGDGATRAALKAFLVASEAEAAGDRARALDVLRPIAEDAAVPDTYRQLAKLKSVLLAGSAMDAAQRDATLAELAQPGAPFRTLAVEQQAMVLLEAGRQDEAVTLLKSVAEDAEATSAQIGRVGQILTALGAGDQQG
ncbi:tetratricopeptide repeat protein [Frigidibacter sp. SD6-1]|uniref:tetratricopeptide repeat protein n=1 Tax=Frigidibacter sp. SD6-1 TaxID=3032581 RepID=UPI0024E00218|nr:tetratricopeptide repeat protein [Frigidibacter sp. SD6-1]